MHWKTQVTEQGSASKKTEYLNYDPFGRPTIIRPPDGSAHDVILAYLGVRKVSRTSKVGNKARRPLIILLAVASAYILLWLGFANPLNLFVPRSERFSMSRFQAIEPGSSIADAVKLLGGPIKVVKRGPLDPSCPSCVAYCFMGEPPNWVIGFQEAWLTADQRGQIVRVFVHTEP